MAKRPATIRTAQIKRAREMLVVRAKIESLRTEIDTKREQQKTLRAKLKRM